MKIVTACFIVAAYALPLAAQDSSRVGIDPTPPHQYRSPQKARVLGSLFPGAGHIYAGEYARGYLIYLSTIAGIGGGIMVYLMDDCLFSWASTARCDPGPQWPHQVLGIAGIGAGLWGWVAGARDAPRAAERANERHRRKNASVSPMVEPILMPEMGVRVGVVLRW